MLGSRGHVEPALMPEWWPLIRAAKYLGVPPWELAERSSYWKNVANEAMTATIRAENAANDKPGGYDPNMPEGAQAGPVY